ncbi:MAG: hypothetical protein ACJAWS_002854 [Oleiphilaceae bacterium]|jgi:hypothetical protein
MRTPSLKPIENNSLAKICNIILDESSSKKSLHRALDDFSQQCSQVTNITPNPTFSAWAKDIFLDQGVAINPEAAAYCIKDYQRSIMFIRGVHAAITEILIHSSNRPVNILYAGCGPFATLLIPLLGKYWHDNLNLSRLNISLLDIHQTSLDSVNLLLNHFKVCTKNISLVHADACTYQHPLMLNLIIAETMQKSLEQEPQFAVTANLAPQLQDGGIFIPEKIVIELCLAQWHVERDLAKQNAKINHESLIKLKKRFPLGTILNLKPQLAATQLNNAEYQSETNQLALKPIEIQIPEIPQLNNFDALFLTFIQVFKHYQLNDYESEITLPLKCQALSTLKSGARYNIRYQLGSYPEFHVSVSKRL